MEQSEIWLVDRETLEKVVAVDWEWVEEHIDLIINGELYELGFSLEL